MQQFRSWLALSIKIFLPLYLILFGGTTYANLRVWWVNYQLFRVAEQLGYTPDTLLRYEVDQRDWGFLLDTNCDTNLYYVTTLSPAEFGERVVQALPETRGQGWSQPIFADMIGMSGLRVGSVDIRETIMLPISEQEKVTSYRWFSDSDRADISLSFYDLANVHAPLDYKGVPITGNIVKLYKFIGAFQVWNCPSKTVEAAPPLSN